MRAFHPSPAAFALTPVLLALGLVACDGSPPDDGTGGSGGGTSSGTTDSTGDTTSTTTETVDPLGPWTFEPITIDALPPVWGGIVAQASPSVAYLAGGVADTTGPVTGDLVKVEQGAEGVTATVVTTELAKRYCGCSFVDTKRKELVVIGGRGSAFSETKNAQIVNLETGAVSSLDPGEAADYPVGCHALFLADRDEGFVFGGVGQGAGFTSGVWRYDPAAKTFTLLDIAKSPPARYDGALRYPVEGGPIWLVSGMGVVGGMAEFYSDVWKLDPDNATWTEVVATGDLPQGRRLPWVAFSGDQSALVMGFGSDSPMGTTMLGDLWRLDLAAGTWSEVPRTGDVDPGERGFAVWLPGPQGSAGLLSGGLTELGLATEALVLQPPNTDGDWR